MARTFVLTDIVDPVKAPFSKRSLEHINEAYNELTKQLFEPTLATAYTTNDVIIISGCDVTANIPGTSSVTAGQIYYNGKIYNVDANASISTPSNTLVWSVATTYISGDPATFSDGNNYNFHKIEKFQLTNAVSGSGVADYNGATVKYKIRTTRININNWNIDGSSSRSVFPTMPISKIIDINLLVWSDDMTLFRNKNYEGLYYTVIYSGASIILQDGGLDSGANWDDNVSNRGYLYITWGDI